MNELQVIYHGSIEVVDSREVARMVEIRHADLLEKVSGYIKHLTNGKIRSLEFFIPSTYQDGKGETRPCYLLTKKGCDMVANKMTGEKGVLFTAAYVTAFEKMREHIQKGKQVPDDSTRAALAEAKLNNSIARLKNSQTKKAEAWIRIAQFNPIPEFQQICAHYASAELTGGTGVLPLPEVTEKTYSAEEVGQMLGGVSANKVGRLANANGLKVPEYGIQVWDKSRHSAKQVPTWRYNDKAVARLREILEVPHEAV